MAGSALYLGERNGARLFRASRVGYDAAGDDLGSHVYTGVFRTERIAPAGQGSLVNFRRVDIHVFSSGTHEFTVKVWVDDVRTTLGDGTTQTVVVSEASGVEGEYTEEVAIQAVGSHIRVELTVDSDDVTAPFLIESIIGRGRVIRGSSSRAGETS